MSYDKRHGGAWDRGSADSYYGRPVDPHYFKGGTYNSEKVVAKDMLTEEIEAYYAGYNWNEKYGDKKDYS